MSRKYWRNTLYGCFFITLVISACVPPPPANDTSGADKNLSISGSLTNLDTGKPLVGARIVLCAPGAEPDACFIDTNLTAKTDDRGKFLISSLATLKYGILYNVSGELQPEWAGMKLKYSPISTESEPYNNLDRLMQSLNLTEIDACQAALHTVNDYVAVSGYFYSSEYDLAFLFIDGEFLSSQAQERPKELRLKVWDTKTKANCEAEFEPMR